MAFRILENELIYSQKGSFNFIIMHKAMQPHATECSTNKDEMKNNNNNKN